MPSLVNSRIPLKLGLCSVTCLAVSSRFSTCFWQSMQHCVTVLSWISCISIRWSFRSSTKANLASQKIHSCILEWQIALWYCWWHWVSKLILHSKQRSKTRESATFSDDLSRWPCWYECSSNFWALRSFPPHNLHWKLSICSGNCKLEV